MAVHSFNKQQKSKQKEYRSFSLLHDQKPNQLISHLKDCLPIGEGVDTVG